jgi:hypothetical protein
MNLGQDVLVTDPAAVGERQAVPVEQVVDRTPHRWISADVAAGFNNLQGSGGTFAITLQAHQLIPLL